LPQVRRRGSRSGRAGRDRGRETGEGAHRLAHGEREEPDLRKLTLAKREVTLDTQYVRLKPNTSQAFTLDAAGADGVLTVTVWDGAVPLAERWSSASQRTRSD